MAVIKSQIHGFPINFDECEVTLSKIRINGQIYDLIDVINGGFGSVTLETLGVTTYIQTVLTGAETSEEARDLLEVLSFVNIAFSGQDTLVANSSGATLTFVAGDGITITTNGGTNTATIATSATGSNTGDQNVFSTVAVSGQDNVVADSTTDTLTLAAGTNIVLTTNAGADTVTVATDPDVLLSDTTDELTAGYTAAVYAAGTKSSGTFTPDAALGNIQSATNNGAHTLAPPSSSCSMVIKYTNGASAGAITTSGFTMVSGSAPGTTDTHLFFAYITVIGGTSHLTWVAMQ
jgi:hypothetical protein